MKPTTLLLQPYALSYQEIPLQSWHREHCQPNIKDRRIGITVKVAGDSLVLSVTWDVLQQTPGYLLHILLMSLYHIGSCLWVTFQIHVRHVMDRNTEGHASELLVHLGTTLPTDLAAPKEAEIMFWSITPQLPRRVHHSFLGGIYCMDCHHEFFHNAKIVMDDLGQRG